MGVEDELEALRLENSRLRMRIQELEAAKPLRSAPSSGQETIRGLDAMVLFISPQGRIRYINSNFARFSGTNRDALVGLPLDRLDQLPWGPGVLRRLWEAESGPDQAQELEASWFDLNERTLKFAMIRATRGEDGMQIVVEDRSHFKQLEGMFRRYVSPRVIERMLASGKNYLSAERAELTLLFSDLRGFTAASKRLAPERVKAMMDGHLGAMIDVIVAQEGTVDKIMGDGVMAFFGAPVQQPEHPVRALNAALHMQRAHEAVVARWREEGLPELRLGIALNSGDVVVGNIGCEQRMDYTALGHEVNVAARLCQAAQGDEILISLPTFQRVRELLTGGAGHLDFPVRFRNGTLVRAKGLDEPVQTVVVSPILS